MSIIERMLGVIAPHNCLVCGDEGDLLCAWCRPDVCEALPSRCYRCQKASLGSRVCINCRRHSKLRHVWAVTSYEGVAKELIHKLKFERALAVSTVISRYLNDTLPYIKPETTVTWVPASTSRLRQRGYDQAEQIAKHFAKQRGLKYARLLARSGQERQVGAKRRQRLAQLEDAFRPLKSYLIDGTRILIIDDVVTTGATLEAAAKTLKMAGAKSVDGAAFAQSI